MGATPMCNIETVISAKSFILDLFEKGACTFGIYSKTCVKHTQLDKTNVSKTNGSFTKVERIAEYSLGAFCNAFDLH